jgi:hypothetical protein
VLDCPVEPGNDPKWGECSDRGESDDLCPDRIAKSPQGSASTTKPSGLREIDWAELGKFPSWRKRPGRTAKRGRLIDSISDG